MNFCLPPTLQRSQLNGMANEHSFQLEVRRTDQFFHPGTVLRGRGMLVVNGEIRGPSAKIVYTLFPIVQAPLPAHNPPMYAPQINLAWH